MCTTKLSVTHYTHDLTASLQSSLAQRNTQTPKSALVNNASNLTPSLSTFSLAPSNRSIVATTPNTFAPASRSEATASSACPPVVATSSMSTTVSPAFSTPSSCFAVP